MAELEDLVPGHRWGGGGCVSLLVGIVGLPRCKVGGLRGVDSGMRLDHNRGATAYAVQREREREREREVLGCENAQHLSDVE